MKLQILIPRYNETEEEIKSLLDSIELQQNIDFKNDIGVIIVDDGSDTQLSNKFLDRYSYHIDYYLNEHKGVSATRNSCLDYATADYIMFCDADDMFYNACGLYIVFKEFENGGFDSLISTFIEETRVPGTGEITYINHPLDTVFVHGKVYRRQYLIDNNIRWNETLTLHEDSYFNCLCQRLAEKIKYSQTSFYLWKWRATSTCRRDSKFAIKTYSNLLDSVDALITQFLDRGREDDAMRYAVNMVYDAYFMMNKDEWLHQEDKNYRYTAERRFKACWLKHKNLLEVIPSDIKTQIIIGVTNRMCPNGVVPEIQSFSDWIKQIENIA